MGAQVRPAVCQPDPSPPSAGCHFRRDHVTAAEHPVCRIAIAGIKQIGRAARYATVSVILTPIILITTIGLLGLSAAEARNASRRGNASYGVVAAWEHIEGRRCGYVHIAGGR
jgi:hypothetical protein